MKSIINEVVAGRRHAFHTFNGEQFHRARRATGLPVVTDLSAMKGRRVLVLVDEDNLRISMQNHEQPLSYRWLLERLHREAKTIFPVAVLTAPQGEQQRELYLRTRGWRVLTIPRETVLTCTGPQIKTNADADIAFELGNLVSTEKFDTVLLGTGDGDLAVAIGRGVRRKRPMSACTRWPYRVRPAIACTAALICSTAT